MYSGDKACKNTKLCQVHNHNEFNKTLRSKIEECHALITAPKRPLWLLQTHRLTQRQMPQSPLAQQNQNQPQ